MDDFEYDYDYEDDEKGEILVDYSSDFPEATLAQGLGSDFLAIYKLDKPFQRIDGRRAKYELEYRWLSQPCKDEADQAYACVLGSEYTYWQANEIAGLLRDIKKGQGNLFKTFQRY